MRPRAAGFGLVLALGVLAGSACGDDEPVLEEADPGASGSGGAPGTGGSGAGGGLGGAGGDGGDGGAGGCVGREACQISTDPLEAETCCAVGEQCCEASAHGYDVDHCRPEGDACPIGCPGGGEACPIGQYCQLDPVAGVYACIADCPGERVCAFNVCCALGSVCKGGGCDLPDLTIDAEQVVASAEVVVRTFAPASCEEQEGCIGAPGKRALLRFDLKTPNVGVGDLELGVPVENELFSYSACHGHFHFEGYATYRLLDAAENVIATGHKQAFCLFDLTQEDPGANPEARYTCELQGIQAGWADVYTRTLPCQWVDVTDVPPGEYLLEVVVNGDHTLGESSYENNRVVVPVTVPGNSCPEGCKTGDAVCCAAGDPCGLAGDGACDCGDLFGWDTADCSACLDLDPACDPGNTCPGGCTPAGDACCVDGDPCGRGGDGACDCAGALDWDSADCSACSTEDPDCPVNSCPGGCTPANPGSACCESAEACNWGGDGYCDCGGAAWDVVDCATCLSDDPSCP